MNVKIKPCTLEQKHKWAWKKNISVSRISATARGTAVMSTLKGLYVCACGASKHGQPTHDGGDLRSIIKKEGGAS